MCERVIVVTLSVVCLLSVADLEGGALLALQRDMNLNWTMIYISLICHFFKFSLVLEKKQKNCVLFFLRHETSRGMLKMMHTFQKVSSSKQMDIRDMLYICRNIYM